MPLPRMTTRRWMIALAGVALLLVSIRLWRLSSDFRSRAAWHGVQEARFKDRLEWSRRLAHERDFATSSVTYSLDRISYHAALKGKDERAARRPWLPVPPDPPEPE